MRAFGVEVEEDSNGYALSGAVKPNRKEPFEVEADYSQAAFWLVARYLGSDIQLKNLPKSTAQGDRAIVDLLAGLSEAGKKSDMEGKKTVFEMDARDVPDLVPVFAIAAAATNCVTKIVHAERLRIKESDRIASTAAMLTELGIRNTITEDGLEIEGRSASVKDDKCFSPRKHLHHSQETYVLPDGIFPQMRYLCLRVRKPQLSEEPFPTECRASASPGDADGRPDCSMPSDS